MKEQGVGMEDNYSLREKEDCEFWAQIKKEEWPMYELRDLCVRANGWGDRPAQDVLCSVMRYEKEQGFSRGEVHWLTNKELQQLGTFAYSISTLQRAIKRMSNLGFLQVEYSWGCRKFWITPKVYSAVDAAGSESTRGLHENV